jgi:hypothetical protein
MLEIEELQVVTFRSDQAQFLAAVTEAYGQRPPASGRARAMDRPAAVVRRKGKRDHKVWVVADPGQLARDRD